MILRHAKIWYALCRHDLSRFFVARCQGFPGAHSGCLSEGVDTPDALRRHPRVNAVIPAQFEIFQRTRFSSNSAGFRMLEIEIVSEFSLNCAKFPVHPYPHLLLKWTTSFRGLHLWTSCLVQWGNGPARGIRESFSAWQDSPNRTNVFRLLKWETRISWFCFTQQCVRNVNAKVFSFNKFHHCAIYMYSLLGALDSFWTWTYMYLSTSSFQIQKICWSQCYCHHRYIVSGVFTVKPLFWQGYLLIHG